MLQKEASFYHFSLQIRYRLFYVSTADVVQQYLVVLPADAGGGGRVEVVLEAVVRVHLWDLHLLRITIKEKQVFFFFSIFYFVYFLASTFFQKLLYSKTSSCVCHNFLGG